MGTKRAGSARCANRTATSRLLPGACAFPRSQRLFLFSRACCFACLLDGWLNERAFAANSPCDMSKNMCLNHHAKLCNCHPSRHVRFIARNPHRTSLARDTSGRHTSAGCRRTTDHVADLLRNCATNRCFSSGIRSKSWTACLGTAALLLTRLVARRCRRDLRRRKRRPRTWTLRPFRPWLRRPGRQQLWAGEAGLLARTITFCFHQGPG